VHLMLAESFEAAKDYDRAIERYRKVLALAPNDPIALNNLAYALSVRRGRPADALAYAERAYALARGNPTVADTLGWVQHLLGKDREAAALLSAAAKGLPDNAEVRLHAAVVYAALGMLEPAARELTEALRLDPALATSDEAKAVRERAKRQ
jgi:Flp pilus assembly protein TadD